MTLELLEISVEQKTAHPRLAGRMTGKVRAVLQEEYGGREQKHAIDIPVWANVTPGTTEEDVDMALMVKAASILSRVRALLGSSASPGTASPQA